MKYELIEHAKFFQNELWHNDIKNYLIGGSLINCIRDNGQLLSDDIDFAVIFDMVDSKSIDNFMNVLFRGSPSVSYHLYTGVLSIFVPKCEDKKIDFFFFAKKYLNYYMFDTTWMHERIYAFQTFKQTRIVLEENEFITMYRPDLFLKTTYGDYTVKRDEYKSPKQGDISHMKTCFFYTGESNYDNVDFQYDKLKIFFPEVVVRRDLSKIDKTKINIFDDSIRNKLQTDELLISDFENFIIKNNIKL